jgi:TonB family protein
MSRIIITLSLCLVATFANAQQDSLKTKSATKQTSSTEAYPTFPGGENALWKYVADNMRYPQDAMDGNVQGIVLVKFVIEYDGSITNIGIKLSISESLDAEAIRIIQSMPKWTKGKMAGQSVRAGFTLPISFDLAIYNAQTAKK